MRNLFFLFEPKNASENSKNLYVTVRSEDLQGNRGDETVEEWAKTLLKRAIQMGSIKGEYTFIKKVEANELPSNLSVVVELPPKGAIFASS
jgi:hypothetical protein